MSPEHGCFGRWFISFWHMVGNFQVFLHHVSESLGLGILPSFEFAGLTPATQPFATREEAGRNVPFWIFSRTLTSTSYLGICLETNIEPENHGSQKESSLPQVHFQVPCWLAFGGVHVISCRLRVGSLKQLILGTQKNQFELDGNS